MDSIVDAVLSGKLNDEQLADFAAKLPEESQKLFEQAKAFRATRQDEESKTNLSIEQRQEAERKATEALATLKTAEEDLLKVQGQRQTTEEQNTQYRQEQVDKAKEAFFTEYAIPAEQRAAYEEEFKKQDSGKIDPELIKKDLVKAYAVLNADTLIDAKKSKDERERAAAEDGANGAGSHDNAPGDIKPPSQFSETAQALSKAADIPVETAERINREGFTRQIG